MALRLALAVANMKKAPVFRSFGVAGRDINVDVSPDLV